MLLRATLANLPSFSEKWQAAVMNVLALEHPNV